MQNPTEKVATFNAAVFHNLCHNGKLRELARLVETMKDTTLAEMLASRKGCFGYTPLHEAVAGGKTKILDFLLEKVEGLPSNPINIKANSGYTPLHLAASSGHQDCVRVLIKRGADISITDEYGKTAKQTAELSSKSKIVQILRSEGMYSVYKHMQNLLQLYCTLFMNSVI